MTECPMKRCDGHLEVWASGLDANGVPAGLGICDRCGRTADVTPDLSEGQDALPGLDGGAA